METELLIKTITHPAVLFKDWTKEEFEEWLHVDRYGNNLEHPKKEFLVKMLDVLEPFEELGCLYDICLQKIIKNECTDK